MHYINQFFAGKGGEDKADLGLEHVLEPLGPGKRLQMLLDNSAEIVVTAYCGDSYFSENSNKVLNSILKIALDNNVEVIIAGPAFLAGRYGFACVEICRFLSNELSLRCVTGMSADNPAVPGYKHCKNKNIFLFPTSDKLTGMEEALSKMASFVSKIAADIKLGFADEEGYVPRGIRIPTVSSKAGAERTLDMLLKKIHGEYFKTEIPVIMPELISPAPPITDIKKAKIALVSTAGVHEAGNPHQFKALANTQWRKYSIQSLNTMQDKEWSVIHGGTSVEYLSQNPNYAVPLDVCREMEKKSAFKELYPYFYGTTGVAATVQAMERVGQEIVADMQTEDVGGALIVST